MENLLTIKNRINTVSSIIKATNAMKMVSSVKLSRITNTSKYSKECSSYLLEMLSLLLNDLSFSQELDTSHYLLSSQNPKKLILIFSTDQGFCAGFNQNIIQEAKRTLETNENSIIKIFGKKAAFISKENLVPIPDRFNVPNFSQKVIEIITKHLENHEVSEIVVISSHFKNILMQKPETITVFPLKAFSESTMYIKTDNDDKTKLLDNLFKTYMQKLFNNIITEHIISELSARVIAMDNSVKSAKDMKKQLNSAYNKLRQDKITKELIEIISSIESAE